MADDDEVVLILGVIATFLLAIVIVETIFVVRGFSSRSACWNIFSAMQQIGATITFNDWKHVLSAGHTRNATPAVYLEILSYIPYDELQAPHLDEVDYEYKLDKHRHTKRSRELKAKTGDARDMIVKEQERRRRKAEDKRFDFL